MLPRVRRFFDIRPGEGLPVLLTFLYIAVVVAAYLLAKPIRNGLFLEEYGPYALVYVYAAVPLVLTLFVRGLLAEVVARFGSRHGDGRDADVLQPRTCCCSGTCSGYLPVPAAARHLLRLGQLLCGVIAPVQAWSFANSLFDTRQAKRLFGLIGSGASFGAITGGVLARYLVEPVGGADQSAARPRRADAAARPGSSRWRNTRIRRKGLIRLGRPSRALPARRFSEIARAPTCG